mmetsp:Transcript_39250/g.77183  ORF Transcript_39250/g.77183 Transcript_39250/m.77183 type:complete len:293 (+) Transcript_39250:63-941(+)|eukprot:CAMPEP_0175089036 /NCGR_PEP_ID=MMETSP0086_2-20121207/573_1 /TAXON_ID=136419 /ORGANISM="Unknown Unknown, Strain D1" /LENGTH=292 /DNA_ID=CAMNT_0016361521 /DNA_START=58 /DNA_END=936 /DNA_ORIENTATION=+
MHRSVRALLGARSHSLTTRSFATKPHTFPNPLPYYPYPKPGDDLDAEDWGARKCEPFELPHVPTYKEIEEGKHPDWINVGPHPKTVEKGWYDIWEPKPAYIYTRTKPYDLKKGYVAKQLDNLFSDCAWMVVLQHSYSHPQYLEFEKKLSTASDGRIKLKTCIKNSLARRALNKSPFAALAPLFTGPTVLAYTKNKENLLPDLHSLIDSCPPSEVLLLGAKVEDGIADFNQIRALKEIKSFDTVVFHLIGALQQPLHGLVKVLKNPQDNLVKTLDFQAKALQPDEAAAAPEKE